MLAIIDGDTLVYKSCPGRKKVNKNQEAIISVDDAGNKSQEFTEKENRIYTGIVWDNFVNGLARIMSHTMATDYVMAIKGIGNFRLDLYPLYKSNRKAHVHSEFQIVNVIRELCANHGYAVRADGCEADDYIRIWAEQAKAGGNPHIICAGDKDLLCIPGLHCRIKSLQEFEVIEVSPFEAKRNFYQQLLSGDMTDFIPGIPGLGPITAKKILADCRTEEEMQEIVVGSYIVEYEDKWRNMLLINGKLLQIQAFHDDFFSLKGWKVAEGLP